MKHVVVILDGAAGWPVEGLGGRTTLETARTPNLDALATEGTVGLAVTVPDGMEPSSSAACTSIMGYDPVADYVGRGAIEAASMGIELAPDEVALRLNLVDTSGGIMRSYSCGAISTDESRPIAQEIATILDDGTFRLHPGIAYRHILVVRGHPELLDAEYTPPHDISDKPIAGHMPSSRLLRDYMDRAREALSASKANRRREELGGTAATDVWPFWPGAAPRDLQPFEARFGLTAAMTSGVDLLNGLAVLTGVDRLDVAGVTSGPDNDYAAQAEAAIDALQDHDVVFVHVESPDEEGHSGNPEGKVEAIEAIDREIVSRLRACVPGLRVLAMPDHPTPVTLKTHVGEPVPFIVWGAGIEANGASSYNERSAAETRLVVDPGRSLMEILLAR